MWLTARSVASCPGNGACYCHAELAESRILIFDLMEMRKAGSEASGMPSDDDQNVLNVFWLLILSLYYLASN